MAKKEKPATKVCKHCKTEIPYSAKVCPNCRKRVKVGAARWIILVIVIVIILIVVISCSVSSSDSEATDESTVEVDAETEIHADEIVTEVEAESENDVEDAVIYDGDTVKISFQRYYEVEEIEGECYIQMLYENKTDEEITVYPQEAYVNDLQVTMGSGVPTQMAAGKKSRNPIFFSYSLIGLDGIEDIETIEISFRIADEELNTLEETDLLDVIR